MIREYSEQSTLWCHGVILLKRSKMRIIPIRPQQLGDLPDMAMEHTRAAERRHPHLGQYRYWEAVIAVWQCIGSRERPSHLGQPRLYRLLT